MISCLSGTTGLWPSVDRCSGYIPLGALLFVADIPMLVRFFLRWYATGQVPEIALLTIIFLTISWLQLFLFAMLFDMQANQDLRGN